MTNSFATILSSKKKYQAADFRNQELVSISERSDSLAIYNGMNCLMALA